MSTTIPPIDEGVEAYLKLFYPQYFDPESPSYVDPDTMAALSAVAADSRPWCLSEAQQDLAQALFTAYLISLQKQSSSGQQSSTYAGPITSEKEGDIAITYGSSSGSTSGKSDRPSNDPWDAWNRLYMRCARGSITTRFGDPCRAIPSQSLTATLALRALSLT